MISHPYKSLAYGDAPLTCPHGSVKSGRSAAAHVPRAPRNGSPGRHSRGDESRRRIQLQTQETKRGQSEGVHHAELAWIPVVLSVFESRERGLQTEPGDWREPGTQVHACPILGPLKKSHKSLQTPGRFSGGYQIADLPLGAPC